MRSRVRGIEVFGVVLLPSGARGIDHVTGRDGFNHQGCSESS